jgi:hypothetical protein
MLAVGQIAFFQAAAERDRIALSGVRDDQRDVDAPRPCSTTGPR